MKREVELHLQRAAELLIVAEELLAGGHPADSVSRSYYAMFHAATGALLGMGIERSSHRALWSAFGEQTAAKALMDPKFHRWGMDAFRARLESDYLPAPEDTPEFAQKLLDQAHEFVAACRGFLKTREGDAP